VYSSYGYYYLYRVKWEEPITVNLRDKMTLFSSPPPGSGVLLGFILNILDGYNLTSESIKDVKSTILTYHRIIEAFKFAYARRTELGDGEFVNITNVSILLMCKV
jgi:gamma-glutamyltranspeptidase/glutathione hydrolase/leukotriene-C4 hydrolase